MARHGASKSPPYCFDIGIIMANMERSLGCYGMMTRMRQSAIAIVLPMPQLRNGTKIAMVPESDGNIVEFVQEVS